MAEVGGVVGVFFVKIAAAYETVLIVVIADRVFLLLVTRVRDQSVYF